MECDDEYNILEPLYDRVTRLPRYGDLNEYFDGNNYGDTSILHDNPIWILVMRCLNEAVTVNQKQTAQMRGFFSMLRVTYLEYLAKLNRYISIYGENGFRMTNDAFEQLSAVNPIGILADDANFPEFLEIGSDSLFKYFKQLPNDFEPPQRIVKQLVVESVVVQELQRVVSMFFEISGRVERDDRSRQIKDKHILRTIVESSNVTAIARSIFESSFRGYNMSRVSRQSLRDAFQDYDDFYANFYGMINQVIIENPEAFGMTYDIIRARRPIERLNNLELERRSLRGIIASNCLSLLPEGLIMRRMSLEEIRIAENTLSLLSEVNERDDRVVSLPIPTRYEEVLQLNFSEKQLPYYVCVRKDASSRFIESETIDYGTFTAQFVTPSSNPMPFPDQVLIETDSLLFWKIGGAVFTVPADMNDIFARWFRTMVFSHEQYVEFKNPLELLMASEKR